MTVQSVAIKIIFAILCCICFGGGIVLLGPALIDVKYDTITTETRLLFLGTAIYFPLSTFFFYMATKGLLFGRTKKLVVSDNPREITEYPKPPPQCYVIRLGDVRDWNASGALSYIQSILSLSKDTLVKFSIVASQTGIEFQVMFLADFLGEDTFKQITQGYYPSAEIKTSCERILTTPAYENIKVFKRNENQEFFEEIISVEQIKQFDPLAQLYQTLSVVLEKDEFIIYDVNVFMSFDYTPDHIDFLMSQTRAQAGLNTPKFYKGKDFWDDLGNDIMRAWRDNTERVSKYGMSDERRYRAKLSQPLYDVAITLQIITPTESRLKAFMPIATSVLHFSAPQHPLIEAGYNSHKKIDDDDDFAIPSNLVVESWRSKDENPEKYDYWDNHTFRLTVSEISALWHLPHEGFEIKRTGNRQVKASDKVLKMDKGVQLGVNRYAGETYPIRMSNNDRTTHAAIIGRTRTGKSTLLHRKIHQDIEQGRGVCVVDPEGELVSHILQNSIPPHRENDVVILDISTLVDGVFYPPPFNVLLNLRSENKQASLRKLNDIFETLFTSFQLKKMADTLSRALQTLEGEPHPTLLDLRRQFIDVEYRNQVTQRITDFVLKQEIERFNKLSGKQQQAEAFPLYWRLQSFYGNPYLRAMTCHPDRFNLHDFVSQNKIILVSLGDEDDLYSDEDRFVLGTSIIHQIELVARSGAITQAPFMLYIDEAQEFIKTRLPNMLSRMGKRGLGVILANQYFGQLFSDTQEAIEGNVGTFISFEIGQKDARTFVPYFDGFTADDLTKLGKYSTVVSMRVGEDRPPAFSMDTLPPPKNEQIAPERELYLRRLSVENMNLKTYGEVNEWLARRYDGVDFTKDTDLPAGFQDGFIEPDEDINNDDEIDDEE